MLKNLSKKEQDIVNTMQARSSFSPTTIREVLEQLGLYCSMAYLEGEEITIPFLGDLVIQYKGDTIINSSVREAELECTFKPSDSLKRSIGKIEDGELDDMLSVFEKKVKTELNVLVDSH